MKKKEKKEKKEKKGLRLALKLSLTVTIPILLITVTGIVLGAVKQANLSESLVQREISGIARSVRQTYTEMEKGSDFTREGDTLMKGTQTLSGDYELLDKLKEEQDVEVSLFYGDTRVLTTLMDEAGKREINTQLSAEVYEKVQKGQEYFAADIELFGNPYSGYYVPLYQAESGEVIGSVFCGRSLTQVNEGLRDTIVSMAAAMIGIFVLAFAIVLFMVIRIVKSIDGAVDNLGNVAKGVLNFEMKPHLLKRGDEVGDIARAIQSLITSLHAILTSIMDSSKALENFVERFSVSFKDISDSITNVNVAIEEVAEGASNQAHETMTANQGVMEMGQALEETARNVETLNSSSDKMKDYNKTAGENLEELNVISEKTRESVIAVQKQTDLTNQSAQQIREATELITNIAAQTNLLSLNASIEAARAGENGRGFAVVADEIRELSEQSKESAERIADIVKALIENSDTSVRTMNDVAENIEIQNDKLLQTGNMFRSLNEEIQEVADAITNIRQQTTVLNEQNKTVTGVVDSLAAIAQENAASTEETSASMHSLNEIIQECYEATGELTKVAKEMAENTKYFQI